MNRTPPLRYSVLRSGLGRSSSAPTLRSPLRSPLRQTKFIQPREKEEALPKIAFDIRFECRQDYELSELLNDPDIIAFAPVMPTKLNGTTPQKITEATDNPQRNNTEDLLHDKHTLPKAANSFGFSGSAGRSGINRSAINGLYNAMYNPGAATWGIKAVRADNSRYTGEGVAVALLDTGIDKKHEAFLDLNLREMDFTGQGNRDRDGHGTHCAGTFFGKDVDGNRIGIAPGIDCAFIGKVMHRGRGDSHMLYQGIEWALNCGAKVIAFALSFDFHQFAADLENQGHQSRAALTIALDAYCQNMALIDKLMSLIACHEEKNGGALLFAAAGNDDLAENTLLNNGAQNNGAQNNGTQNNGLQHYDFQVNARVTPCLPAAASDVISVGAVQYKPDRISLTNASACLPDIVGPGTDILSAKKGGGLVRMSGSSMACPHVAGVAVLYLEEVTKMGLRPGLWCEAVRDKMASRATSHLFDPHFEVAETDNSSSNTQPSSMNYGVGLAQAPQ